MNTISWGGMRLSVERATSPIGRTLVIQSPAKGSRHFVTDKGQDLRTFAAELVFFDDPRETESAEQRYLRFLGMIDGTSRILVHPRHGGYLAKVRNATLSEDSTTEAIRVSADFVPDDEVVPVLELGAGGAAVAGPEAVSAAASLFETDLEDIGASSVASNAPGTVAAWTEDDPSLVTPARVEAEVSSAIADIDAEIEDLELATLENWQAFRSAMLLRARLQDAAAAVIAESPRLYSYKVEVSASLRVILRGQYGAARSRDLEPEVVNLNSIRSPAWIEAGTVLRLPVVQGR